MLAQAIFIEILNRSPDPIRNRIVLEPMSLSSCIRENQVP
jgi:hypothetical protein